MTVHTLLLLGNRNHLIIRLMKDFDKYKQTIARLPFTTIFALNDPEGHLGILNDLAIKHLEEHVLMKRI